MSALSHLTAHEIARDLGCLVSSQKLARSSNFADTSPFVRVRPSMFARLVAWISLGLQRRRTMNQLRQLPDFMLEDIGLSRGDICRVASDLTSRRPSERRLAA